MLLPAPLGPISPNERPGSTRKLTSSKAHRIRAASSLSCDRVSRADTVLRNVPSVPSRYRLETWSKTMRPLSVCSLISNPQRLVRGA